MLRIMYQFKCKVGIDLFAPNDLLSKKAKQIK